MPHLAADFQASVATAAWNEITGWMESGWASCPQPCWLGFSAGCMRHRSRPGGRAVVASVAPFARWPNFDAVSFQRQPHHL